MIPRGFSRDDFAAAWVAYCGYSKDEGLVCEYKELKYPRLYELGDGYVCSWSSGDKGEREGLRGLEPGAAVVYLWIVAKYRGVKAALTLANQLATIADPAGVTICLKSSEEDPFRIDAHAQDDLAGEWADYHGSLQGSTWEGEEDFIYDSFTWHKKLIEELEADGLNLDLGEYSEPDEDDMKVAEHMGKCDTCDWDFSHGKKHVARIDEFFNGYVQCALCDFERPDANPGELFGKEKDGWWCISKEAMASMREDCDAFCIANRIVLKDLELRRAGVGFWMARNGLVWALQSRERLTKAAMAFSRCELFRDADGLLRLRPRSVEGSLWLPVAENGTE